MFIQIQFKFCYKNHLQKTVQGQNPVLQFYVTKSQIMQSTSVRGYKVKFIYKKKLWVTKTKSFTKAFDHVKVQNKIPEFSP